MTCTYPCPYCHNGTVSTLNNYADFHFDSSEPIFEESPCEECGGSGYIEMPQDAEEVK